MQVLKCPSCVTLMQALNLFESYFLPSNKEFIITVKLYYFKVFFHSKFLWFQTCSSLIYCFFFFKWAYPPSSSSSSEMSFPKILLVMVATDVLRTGDQLCAEFLHLYTWAYYLALIELSSLFQWKYTHKEVQCTNLFIKHLLHVRVTWMGKSKTSS